MRKWILLAAFAIGLVAYAPTAFACYECGETFYWAADDYCPYCDPTYCGYFSCYIRQLGVDDYCVGDDPGCFDAGQGCPQEPGSDGDDVHDPEHRIGPHASKSEQFEDAWRLVRARIVRPQRHVPHKG